MSEFEDELQSAIERQERRVTKALKERFSSAIRSGQIASRTANYNPGNPCPAATANVLRFRTLPIPTECNNCGSMVRWSNNAEVYGRSWGLWPFVYQCTSCDSYVGMHPRTAIPLGTLADKATREARKTAKALFNDSWQDSTLTRGQAYHALAMRLAIPIQDCHFGWFDVNRCNQVIFIIKG